MWAGSLMDRRENRMWRGEFRQLVIKINYLGNKYLPRLLEREWRAGSSSFTRNRKKSTRSPRALTYSVNDNTQRPNLLYARESTGHLSIIYRTGRRLLKIINVISVFTQTHKRTHNTVMTSDKFANKKAAMLGSIYCISVNGGSWKAPIFK